MLPFSEEKRSTVPRASRLSIPVLAVASLAACGGQLDATPARSDGTPVLATLASPAGPGTERLRAGDLAGARAHYEGTLAKEPDSVAALNDLAVSYYLEGRRDSARSLLEEVIARGGPAEEQAALVNLGELYALDGYLSAAQAYFESARSTDQRRATPLYALALLADGRGDTDSARALMKDAMRLDDAGEERARMIFVYPEERQHLDAMAAEAGGDLSLAQERWLSLKAGRIPALTQAARRHVGDDGGF